MTSHAKGRTPDPCREDIVDHIFDLIKNEPDLAYYDFGIAKQGSHIYITVFDQGKLRTFNLWFKEEGKYEWDAADIRKHKSQAPKDLT